MKLSIRRGGKPAEMTNRIYVDRPLQTPANRLHTFDEYLRIIETYDPKTLDAPSLRQMVLALEAKALALANQAEDAARRTLTADEDRRRPEPKRKAPPGRSGPADEPAVRIGPLLGQGGGGRPGGLRGDSAAKGDDDLLKLAQLIGPMARIRLGDSEAAFEIWQGAVGASPPPEPKAECEIAAADVAINDLLNAAAAKPLLEAATQATRPRPSGPVAAKLQRVWGDYYAATGDGPAARKAYRRGRASWPVHSRRFAEKAGLARRPCPLDRGVHQGEAVRPGGRGDSSLAAGSFPPRSSTAT